MEKPDEFDIRIIEVLAAFSSACILTTAFMEGLHWPGYLALYGFSASLPALVVLRLDVFIGQAQDTLFSKWHDRIRLLTYPTVIVSFTLLLAQMSWWACGIFYGVVGVLMLLLSCKTAPSTENKNPPAS